MAQPPDNVTFATGFDPQTVELNDDNNDSLSDQINNIIQGLYETAKDTLQDLLKCPGGQRRGWKILKCSFFYETKIGTTHTLL